MNFRKLTPEEISARNAAIAEVLKRRAHSGCPELQYRETHQGEGYGRLTIGLFYDRDTGEPSPTVDVTCSALNCSIHQDYHPCAVVQGMSTQVAEVSSGESPS